MFYIKPILYTLYTCMLAGGACRVVGHCTRTHTYQGMGYRDWSEREEMSKERR